MTFRTKDSVNFARNLPLSKEISMNLGREVEPFIMSDFFSYIPFSDHCTHFTINCQDFRSHIQTFWYNIKCCKRWHQKIKMSWGWSYLLRVGKHQLFYLMHSRQKNVKPFKTTGCPTKHAPLCFLEFLGFLTT